MRALHAYIIGVICTGVIMSLLLSGNVVITMINAALIGGGILGLYHIVKRMRGKKFKTTTVNLGSTKNVFLVPRKNPLV